MHPAALHVALEANIKAHHGTHLVLEVHGELVDDAVLDVEHPGPRVHAVEQPRLGAVDVEVQPRGGGRW